MRRESDFGWAIAGRGDKFEPVVFVSCLGFWEKFMSEALLLAGLFDFVGGIDFQLIFTLISLFLIVVAGPAVVAILAFQGGNDM